MWYTLTSPSFHFNLHQLLRLLITALACIYSVRCMRRSLAQADRRFSYGMLELAVLSLAFLPPCIMAAYAFDYWQAEFETRALRMLKAVLFLVSIVIGAALGRVSAIVHPEVGTSSSWRSGMRVAAGCAFGMGLQFALSWWAVDPEYPE